MAINELSADKAFAHVIWAAHILADLSGKNQSLGSISGSDLDDNEDEDKDQDQSNAGADIKSDVNDELVPYAVPLREKFLDCIAELLSRKKGWHHVTATAIREHEDFVEVDVARNSGIEEDDDRAYFILLEKFMASHHEVNGEFSFKFSPTT